jgi:hypothetical protein
MALVIPQREARRLGVPSFVDVIAEVQDVDQFFNETYECFEHAESFGICRARDITAQVG